MFSNLQMSITIVKTVKGFLLPTEFLLPHMHGDRGLASKRCTSAKRSAIEQTVTTRRRSSQ